MDDVVDFLDLVESKSGLIYVLVALLTGFVCGILVSRRRRKSKRITRLESLEEQFVRLDEELERLVEVAGRVWAKANPGSSASAQTSRPIGYRMHKRSWIKSFYRKTLGKIIKKITKRKKRKTSDPTSYLAASVVRLKSQTDKISLAESRLPSRSQEAPQILRANDAREKTGGFDKEVVEEPGAGSLYRDWQENRENRIVGTPQHSFQRSDEYSLITPDALLELYNHAVNDNFAREEFRERYQPIRLGTVNAVERRQNPTAIIKPEFRETTDGDFFAFPFPEGATYKVVPRLGLTVGAVSYNAGALGEMFGNPSYDPAQSYSHYQVRQPALFKRDGDNWLLDKPGKLELGDPD